MNVLKLIGAVLISLIVTTCNFAQPPVKEVPEQLYRPFDGVVLSHTDAQAIKLINDSEINVEYCRYLSLHNIPKKDRPVVKAVADYVLNSLNTRYTKLIRTAPVPAGDDPVVIRVNLKDYNIDPKAWDSLAEKGSGQTPLPDPYFHASYIKTTIKYKEYEKVENWPGGIWPSDGKNYPANAFTYRKFYRDEISRERSRIFQAAPWLALEPASATPGATIADLMSLTQTKNPILRADWFIVYASWAPRYYELIGLKQTKNKAGELVFLEKDFQKLMKLNVKEVEEDLVASIADSKIVTLHNRILHRFPTANGIDGGYYWESDDTDTGVNSEDYMLNVHNFQNPKIKAKEIIASGRNKFHFYAVASDAGELLNFAVQSIALHGDKMPTKWQDKTVWVARNCMLCHAGGQITIKDKVRGLARGKIALLVKQFSKQDELFAKKIKEDPELIKKIEEAFSPELQPIIDTDNAKYTTAIKTVTGMDARVLGQTYEDIVLHYYDEVITPEKAALEAGVPLDRLMAALKAGVGLDYTVTSLLQQPPIEVSRLPWENQGHFSMMQQLIAWEAAQKK